MKVSDFKRLIHRTVRILAIPVLFAAVDSGQVHADIPFFADQINLLEDDGAASQNIDLNGDGFLGVGDTVRGIVNFYVITDATYAGSEHIGRAGSPELSAIFEVEVQAMSFTRDGRADYYFGPYEPFASLGPDNAAGTGDELSPGTMIAFYEDPSPDFDRMGATIEANEATATDPYGPAIWELGFGRSVVTGAANDADQFWVSFGTPVDLTSARSVPYNYSLGYFSFGLSILAERFSNVDYSQIQSGIFAIDDGWIDVRGGGSILGTSGRDTNIAHDAFIDMDLQLKPITPLPAGCFRVHRWTICPGRRMLMIIALVALTAIGVTIFFARRRKR